MAMGSLARALYRPLGHYSFAGSSRGFIVLGGVGSRAALGQRASFLWQYKGPRLLALGLAALMHLPQVLYWYEATGHWWVSAYADNGEGFFCGQPRLGEILIGYRKGWLVYTPMILLYFLYKNQFS